MLLSLSSFGFISHKEIMELKDFVSNTLTQIAQGVQAAIDASEGLGYTVNPTTIDGRVYTIHFDLGIESEQEGGANIKVLNGAMREKTANRITFDVNVMLPSKKSSRHTERPTYDDE